jgi:hypothetical protein
MKNVWRILMIKSTFLLLCLLLSEATLAKEKRIYQTDPYGNIQYNKPSYEVRKDGRVIENDPYGNKQYHKPQYQIKGNEIYQMDGYGNILYNKPHKEIK